MTRNPLLALIMLGVLAFGAPATAENAIRIKGSDTIGGKLTPELAEAFRATIRPDQGFTIEALGSSTAFVGLFDGSADLGESSRPINEKELDTAHQLGITLRELVIGYDGVAVVVHPSNPVKELSVTQLSGIFTGKLSNWKQLGGVEGRIRLISRPSYSGTHSFFKEKALRRGNAKGPEEFAATTEWMEENGAIIAAVGSDPTAVSYVGLGWVRPQVRAVPVVARPGEPGVPATTETVRTGRYPLYRALLMYVPPSPQPSILQFLRFVLSPAGARIVQANGFVPADEGSPLPSFLATVTLPAAPVTQATAVVSTQPVTVAGAAAPAPPPATPEPTAPPRARELVRVFFPFGAVTLTSEAQSVLDGVAGKLRPGDQAAIVSGHADTRGPVEVNRRVAVARAQAVASFLASRGVPSKQLRVDGAGADSPIASNDTPAGRAQNRRVDIELVPLSK